MNVLIAALGSLISSYLIKLIYGTDFKEKFIDISVFGYVVSVCDEFYISPEVSNPEYSDKVDNLIEMKSTSI
jgi:hypothetical protein